MSAASNMTEALLFCPVCGVDKFTVIRVPTANAGVYTNDCRPIGGAMDHKNCDSCRTPLERRYG